ncbi:acetyl-CoA carboxylase biotin carboxyl carrier protein [Gracilibacillus orientalis]|uniref:Biotin carboxyl carrier protein of acetyl-CoA carboxylase n=1 Tax=Gracilibacillus orientalis TaxID=334253 RepID=A0A1I4KWF8_9BACI|nr:acetyl-CoA carboxylase biotin carboxyl carrier protein [Gracilibacillus orientalis]SFL82946.1 acetyl-CoA carboxylase biotin carboxyl carrier protein [Gracilibacillus orientalis]
MLTIQEINQLIDKLDQSTIDEFSYEANGGKIKLKKNTGDTRQVTSQPVVQSQESVPQVNVESTTKSEVSTEETETKEEAQPKADYDHEIVSPMVGTFYSSPSPDKPVFVHVGDQVNDDAIVCIVEAMKLFNEIEADVTGTITEILAENGELVEYGQPLFRIKKA